VEQYLPYLLFLACPIGMGIMMWMMMRGQRSADDQPQRPEHPDPRITELESQVNELKAALRDRSPDATGRG
jgi:hypothetical protein